MVTPVMDVPSRCSLSQSNNSAVSQAPSVRSPEQVDVLERILPARPRSSANSRRPTLQHRVTSPHSPEQQRAQLTLQARSLRVTSTSAGKQQWTLFGQLMENELWGSGSRKVKKPSTGRSSSSMPQDAVQSTVVDLPASGSDMSEDDYDSDDHDSDMSQTPQISARPLSVIPAPRWYSIRRLSNLHRSIIKCVIAYFIASLFTFSPYLSGFVSDITSDNEPGNNRPSPAGHMVATVYVPLCHVLDRNVPGS